MSSASGEPALAPDASVSPPPPEGIDAAVWFELPDDIRRELARDAQRTTPAPAPAAAPAPSAQEDGASNREDMVAYLSSLNPQFRSPTSSAAQLMQMPPELRGEAEFLRFERAFEMRQRQAAAQQQQQQMGARLFSHHHELDDVTGLFDANLGAAMEAGRGQRLRNKMLVRESLSAPPVPALDIDLEAAKWTLEQFSQRPSPRLESLLILYALSPATQNWLVDELLACHTSKLHELRFLVMLIQARPAARKRVMNKHGATLFALLARVGQEKTKYHRTLDVTKAILCLLEVVLGSDKSKSTAPATLLLCTMEEERAGLEALSRLLADEDFPDRDFEFAKRVAQRLTKQPASASTAEQSGGLEKEEDGEAVARHLQWRINVLLGDLDATCENLAKTVAQVSLKQASMTLDEQLFLRVIKTVKSLRGSVKPTPQLNQVWEVLDECIKKSVLPPAQPAASPAPPAVPQAAGELPPFALAAAAAAANEEESEEERMARIAQQQLEEQEALDEEEEEEEEDGSEEEEEDEEALHEIFRHHLHHHGEAGDEFVLDADDMALIGGGGEGGHGMRNAFSQMMNAIVGGGGGGDNAEHALASIVADEEDDGEEEEEEDEDEQDEEDEVEESEMMHLFPASFAIHHPSTRGGGGGSASASSANSSKRYLCIVEAFFVVNEEDEALIEWFGAQHAGLLNELIAKQPALLTTSLECLVTKPALRKLLNFDNKRAFFKAKMRQRQAAEPRTLSYRARDLRLNIRRKHVFDDSYAQLRSKSAEEMRAGGLHITFRGEEAVDVGGPTKEWFSILIREMFKPGYALFKKAENAANAYQPDPRSSVAIGSDHLDLFKFVGRVIGKAVSMNQLVDVHFTRSFYKHLLGGQVTVADLESLDMEYYKSLMKLLEMPEDVSCLELHFTTDIEQFGVRQTVELKPNGSLIKVTEENKHEYVKLAAHHKMSISIQKQIDSFVQGFYDLVPKELISIFSPQEMELLLSGTPTISVADLKRHTEYHGGYTAESKQIEWFWETLHQFGQEDRAKFLMFVTGTSQVPLGGFANLTGMRGNIQHFAIHRAAASDTMLPSSHTCFHQLVLPQYPSKAVLREKLLLAVTECSEGFGFV